MLHHLTAKKDVANEHHQNSIGTEQEQAFYDFFLNAEQELNNLMKQISLSYAEFNNQLSNIVGQIRKEMKKFDF